MTLLLILFILLALVYYFSLGDKRYDGDGIGKIVRLFQFITFKSKPATKLPRKKYVEILKSYIDNFNEIEGDIIGDSSHIKEEVYFRMTRSKDYHIFEKISGLMILLANGEASMLNAVKIMWYLLRSGVYNHDVLIMKISLSATLCTLMTLPDDCPRSLKEKALHYKLIRCKDDNPFVGISACPMLRLWKEINVPVIINSETPELRGSVIKYAV
eukprot:TRINITY_DN1178_c0_g1_i1.p1 TRINITY_DN1178_c0_g1~~TRINITY_DN1178_c0_g1_i1.p1  ORF type:complete len:214 (+),score=23.84 TRINITY_DN1178_c0_g1_i1:143-784(+)